MKHVSVGTTYRPCGPVFRDSFIHINNGGNDKSANAKHMKGVPFQNGASRFVLTGLNTPARKFQSPVLKGSKTGVSQGPVWMSTAQASYKWPKKNMKGRGYGHGTPPRPVQLEARPDVVFDGFTQSEGRAPRRVLSASASTPQLRRRLQPLPDGVERRTLSSQSRRHQFNPQSLRGSASTQSLLRTQKAPLRRPRSESSNMSRTMQAPVAQAY